MKAKIQLLLTAAASFVGGVVVGGLVARTPAESTPADVRREIFVDTIPYYKPVPRDSLVVRYVTATLPLANDSPAAADTIPCDSATVSVPITQTVYADSAYTAHISGYAARLDSIFVYPRREVVTISRPPKRWGLSVSAGYAATPKGMQPYIGVGISYSLIHF